MPNGGSDCCGTCWFLQSNQGERGYPDRWDDLVSPHCEIRDEPIESPFWTYCANHPHRRSARDPIPIGPILVPGGQAPDERVAKKPSPDTEEIRLHLLRLLDGLHMTAEADAYPTFPRVTDMVVWQLGEFREQRAVEMLRRLNDEGPKGSAAVVQQALKRIIEGTEQDFPLASLHDALTTESHAPVIPQRGEPMAEEKPMPRLATESQAPVIQQRRQRGRPTWISRWRRSSR